MLLRQDITNRKHCSTADNVQGCVEFFIDANATLFHYANGNCLYQSMPQCVTMLMSQYVLMQILQVPQCQ